MIERLPSRILDRDRPHLLLQIHPALADADLTTYRRESLAKACVFRVRSGELCRMCDLLAWPRP